MHVLVLPALPPDRCVWTCARDVVDVDDVCPARARERGESGGCVFICMVEVESEMI